MSSLTREQLASNERLYLGHQCGLRANPPLSDDEVLALSKLLRKMRGTPRLFGCKPAPSLRTEVPDVG